MSILKIINPATNKLCATYNLMQQKEINHIINLMPNAQQKWANESIELRTKYLLNLAKLLNTNKKKYAEIITTEMGKPITQAILEIEKCVALCEYYAEHSESFLVSQQIKTEFFKSYKSFHPLGIIFAIMPWNFPFWQVFRFAVPNLMAGNACLLKHASQSTGASLLIEKIFLEAGFPENLFRSLVIDSSNVEFVIKHPTVMGVTLTGSNQTGEHVAAIAGSCLKKVILELGGSDPYIILEDADLDFAAQQCVLSRLSNAGQVCIAAKRIIVLEKVYAKFTDLILKYTQTYKYANPELSTTSLGPMARNDLRIKLHEQVQRSINMGAICLLGGRLPDTTGFYYPATILTNLPINSPALTEELFGPVICLINAKDEQEAIKIANQTPFGLAGAVFTQNIAKGEHIANNLINAGTCGVNTLIASDPRLPFGGIKKSGFGRELSMEGIHEFVNIKTIMINKI